MYEKMKKKASEIKHPNKEYQERLKQLFIDMFNEREKIQKEFEKKNPNYKPCLDGGCTKDLRLSSKKYFRLIEQLKKEYGIDE